MLNSSVFNSLSAETAEIKRILETENGNAYGNDDDPETGEDQMDNGDEDKINNGLHYPPLIGDDRENDSGDHSSLECSYVDAHLLEQQHKMLNVYIDKLISVNSRVTREKSDLVNEKLACQRRIDELVHEKNKMENELKDAKRSVDLLQEELNDKHLQLSALKTRLDGTSCLDINQLKSSINDLKRSLTIEQEKSEQLISKVDGLQLALEEKNNRISQLINELHLNEAEKGSLEVNVQNLMKEKQFLIEKKVRLEQQIEDMLVDREIDAEEARARLQDSAKANNMIPQLMQLVIRDKNDEIAELVNQLTEIKEKLHLALPYSPDPSDPVAQVDELVNNYLCLSEKYDVRRAMKSSVHVYAQCPSISNSPRSLYYEDQAVSSSSKSFGSSSSSVRKHRSSDLHYHLQPQQQQHHQQSIANQSCIENQLCELQLKYDKMYFAMNNLREENEILKHEIETMREEKQHQPFPVSSGTASIDHFCGKSKCSDLIDKDSDFIDEEDCIEDALHKIHKQSAELLVLSESSKSSQDSVIKAIIDVLPILLIDNSEALAKYGNDSDADEEEDDQDQDEKFIGLYDYHLNGLFTSEEMENFLNKFAYRKLGIRLLEKLLKIKRIYSDSCEKIKFYVTQNETISGQLSTVEEALLRAQSKLDVYQKKYDKVKRKLKERSNEIITVPEPKNSSNNHVTSDPRNVNSQPQTNPPHPNHHPHQANSLCKGKAMDQCNHSELYQQYRRCLSHRNSLIYQKKYLLNVLGGYKLPERATLALLANPNVTSDEELPVRTETRIRFKSVAHAMIATFRLNYIRLKHSTLPQQSARKPNDLNTITTAETKLAFSSPTSHKSTTTTVPTNTIPITLPPTLNHPSSSPSLTNSSNFRSSSTSVLPFPLKPLANPHLHHNQLSSLRCMQTNATIKEFVARLQRLYRALEIRDTGLEVRYTAAEL